jgi:hypothetical protein
MGTASLRFDAWTLACRQLRRKMMRQAAPPACIHMRSLWKRLQGTRGTRLQGTSYCLDRCLEGALNSSIASISPAAARVPAHHRIPLGLLLISRDQLSGDGLRAALEAQRRAGRGRIGEWLQTLGLASEQDITAALARQWSCPVLRADSAALRPGRAPRFPSALLQSFSMLPIDYIEATGVLHMAFSEEVNYGVLHAIEQMLGCRTDPCLTLPSRLRPHLAALAAARDENEVVFDRVEDAAESARIIRSYAARISASEIRMASCSGQLWVRLLRSPGRTSCGRASLSPPLDLLLRIPSIAAAPDCSA